NPSFALIGTAAPILMNGGEIIISAPASATTGAKDYIVRGDVSKSEYKGTALRLGIASGVTQGKAYHVGGNIPHWYIDSALQATDAVEVALLEGTTVFGKLYLSQNDLINLNDEVLTLANDSLFTEGNIIDVNGDGRLVLASEINQSFSGAGEHTVPNLELFASSENAMFTLTNDSSL